MTPSLPLEQMSVEEKLRAMEEIWASLLHDEQDIPSPGWHADVLATREARIREGKTRFIDWEEVKRTLREAVREG